MAIWAVEKTKGLAEKAWTEKALWAPLLSESYEYALPDRNTYHNNGTGHPQGSAGSKGTDRSSRRVFDSTLMNDAVKLANRLQSELFPIGHQWANLAPGAFVPKQVQQKARADLHALQQVLFAAIMLSNFDLAIAEWLLELVIAGTAVMVVQKGDDDNPVVFQAVPQSFVAFREGAFGRIDLMARKHRMRVSLIKSYWDDATIEGLVPPGASIENQDPEVDLLDVNYYDHEDKVWRNDVIAVGKTGAKEGARIVERESVVNRWVIARWTKAPGEAQGRSLVQQALPDARVLSAVKNYLLRQAALAIGGVFLVRNNGVVNANNVRIFPGATIPVQSTGGTAGASIAPLQVGGDIQLAQLVIEDLVNSIHKTMLNNGIPDTSQGIRSATEFIERMKDLQQSLGAPFARVLKEGIVPMLEAVFAVLGEQDVVPVPENGKIKLNSGQISLKFTSPLVQGQNLRDVEAVSQSMGLTKELAGEQAVGVAFKVEDLGEWLASKLGADPALVRDAAQRETLQKQAGVMMAAQANGGVMPGAGGGQTVPAQPANSAAPMAQAA